MLTANQLRQVAGRSGVRDIGNVEIDVILTYVLQLFAEKGVMDHVGFKGGTMLRKTRPQAPLDQVIQRVVEGFRFLGDLTDLERNLAGDDARRRHADAEALRDDVKGRASAH